MHFAITPKTVKINKTLRGRTNFEGRLLKNNIKIVTKLLQNEGAQKASQKPLQKSILGRILASKTLPKSKKKPLKTMLKKEHEKNTKKVPRRPSKETCLSKEREERRHLRVVEACNPKAENVKLVPAKLSKGQKAKAKNTRNKQKLSKNSRKTAKKRPNT